MKGQFTIDFPCQSCTHIIDFQLKKASEKVIVCQKCFKSYEFDKQFSEKLLKMMKLLTVIRESKDLFSDSFISINDKDTNIEIPYKILLTRFNSVIKLKINQQTIPFKFRFQPTENKILKQS